MVGVTLSGLFAISLTVSTTVLGSRVVTLPHPGLLTSVTFSRALRPVSKLSKHPVNRALVPALHQIPLQLSTLFPVVPSQLVVFSDHLDTPIYARFKPDGKTMVVFVDLAGKLVGGVTTLMPCRVCCAG